MRYHGTTARVFFSTTSAETFCDYCGRKHQARATQCEGCGAPVTATQVTAVTAVTPDVAATAREYAAQIRSGLASRSFLGDFETFTAALDEASAKLASFDAATRAASRSLGAELRRISGSAHS